MSNEKNVLIVESKNDEIFLKTLINHLNIDNIVFHEPICRIDDYECMEGLNPTKLQKALFSLKNKLPKSDIKMIGIVIDHDGKYEERLSWINEAIKKVFESDKEFSTVSEIITISVDVDVDDRRSLKLSYFLTNVNGKGELETLLKAIKSQDSVYADCLETWRACLQENGKSISEKEFDKFWHNNYIRFDTCTNREKKQAERKCSMRNFEYIMGNKKNIWNFEHETLNELKDFLAQFKTD